jgi:hypothetical protein
MKNRTQQQITIFALALVLSLQCNAFSPVARTINGKQLLRHQRSTNSVLFNAGGSNQEEASSNNSNVEGEEEEQTPTPIADGLKLQAESFVKAPEPQQRMDPLIASLTKMDADMANPPTTKLPLLGEMPLENAVFLPVAVIAVVGFIMSINIAFKSADDIVQKMDEINSVLSTPPAKPDVVSEGCRGLCSDQDQQLDNMRAFMNSLKKDSGSGAIDVLGGSVEIQSEASASISPGDGSAASSAATSDAASEAVQEVSTDDVPAVSSAPPAATSDAISEAVQEVSTDDNTVSSAATSDAVSETVQEVSTSRAE